MEDYPGEGESNKSIPGDWKTLVDALRFRAEHQSERRAYTFLSDGETEEAHLTFGELDRRARAIAVKLRELEGEGQRVILLYPQGLAYIAAFFGCLYAGAVAVPAYPPSLNRPAPRIQAIADDSQASIALTTSEMLPKLQRWFEKSSERRALHWLATDRPADDLAASWQEPNLNSDSIAFLQYTSGSTATPKGVIVTHRNLLHNERMIHNAFGCTEQSIVVGWLPVYHDMGLIGIVLHSLYLGIACILMSPVAFLQKPVRWLQVISRYHGTTSAAPNFAYEFCIQRITPEERERLDLSSWSQALNGAEPVRAETLERFSEMFASCGFRRKAFYPCYGLAEATLVVSGAKKGAVPIVRAFEANALERNQVKPVSSNMRTAGEDNEIRMLVSSGHNLHEQQVIIVDPESCTPCPANQVGEIWVKGPSVAEGYWNRPHETDETFHAYLADKREGPFLRTGDLGFIYEDEVYITGRLKDLIIIRGRNHYPQDIELTVERSHPALQSGAGAAFSIDRGGEERLVIVHELKREQRHADINEVVQAIRKGVSSQHELQVYSVKLLKPASIPKTSSGKIQRRACRSGFLAGKLNVLGEWSLEQDQETLLSSAYQESLPGHSERGRQLMVLLRGVIARALEVGETTIDIRQPLSSLGVDSLRAVEIKFQIEDALGAPLAFDNLNVNDSITDLAHQILRLESGEPSRRENVPARNSPVSLPTHEHPMRRNGAVESRSQRLLISILRSIVFRLWSISGVGTEGLPENGPFILCPNHESYFDPVWVAACLPDHIRRRLTWMVMREAFENPLMRPAVTRLAVSISVDRTGNPAPALRQALQILGRGEPLIVFPEGTMSRDGTLGPFQRGAAWLALATGALLIPVRIDGAYEIYAPKRLLPRFYDWKKMRGLQVRVAFGAPIVPPIGERGRMAETALTDRLRAAVNALSVRIN